MAARGRWQVDSAKASDSLYGMSCPSSMNFNQRVFLIMWILTAALIVCNSIHSDTGMCGFESIIWSSHSFPALDSRRVKTARSFEYQNVSVGFL